MERTYENRTEWLRIRLKESEREMVERGAARARMRMSEWVRMLMMREAKEAVADGKGTEGV